MNNQFEQKTKIINIDDVSIFFLSFSLCHENSLDKNNLIK